MKISNALHLLSPKTWIGAANVVFLLGALPNCSRLVALVTLFVALCIMKLMALLFIGSSSAESSNGSVRRCEGQREDAPTLDTVRKNKPTWLSTTSSVLLILAALILNDASPIIKWVNLSFNERFDVLPEALDLMSERIKLGRAQRFTRYDLYLPPGVSLRTQVSQTSCGDQSDKKSRKVPALVFIPGALVDHLSYAPVMAQLADKGVLIAVMSMEPLRRPWANLGADDADVIAVMNDAAKNIRTSTENLDWSIGGHSMGAYAAMFLAKSLDMKKLVIWAGGKYENFVPDLSDLSGSLDVLSVQATKDGIAKFADRAEEERFQSKMPKGMIARNIKGGNHAGFAAYSKRPPDENSTISREKQHRILCDITKKFLLQ